MIPTRSWSLLPGTLLSCLLLVLGTACGGLSVAGTGSAAATPAIQGVSPTSQYAGLEVTLTGSGFTGAVQVAFGGRQALEFKVVADNRIVATVPSDAASGTITVTGASGAAASSPSPFKVIAAPSAPAITGFPPSAKAGQSITIEGSGFLAATAVLFGGVPADTFQPASDTSITATVPSAARTGLLSVEVPGGATAYSDGTFTAIPVAPGLDPLATTSGSPGQDLTLTGSSLAQTTSVFFGGGQKAAIKAAADTSLTVTIPETATTGAISVTTPGGTAITDQPFQVLPLHITVSGYAPDTAPEGGTVTITGTNLGRVTAVSFAGVLGLETTPSSDGSSLEVKVPPDAAPGALTLVTPDGDVPVGTFTGTSPALAATGFQPAQGKVGDTVTVAGAHLDQVIAVSLNPAEGPVTVSADGATLTFKVPPGAKDGPVTLVAAGGSIQVQGGNFTVLVEAPAITGFNPPQGVPGTEVTLTGTGLGEVASVEFGGGLLDVSRFNVDSDTQVRVRVPDDAQGDGTLTLASEAGSATTGAAFAVQPSRAQELPRDLAATAPPSGGVAAWRDFPQSARSALYGLQVPTAPVFQASSVDGSNADGTSGLRNAAVSKAQYTCFLKLPGIFLPALPQGIQDQLQSLGIAPADLDILCASQDLIYDGASGAGGIYLFRPNYWTDPDAPAEGAYDQTHNLSATLFGTGPGITLGGLAEGKWVDFTVRTHGPAGGTDGPIIADPGAPALGGLDLTASTAFWSLVVDKDTRRAAATLHLLFNDADQATLNENAPHMATLSDVVSSFGSWLDASRPGLALFLHLFRPMVDSVTLAAPDSTGAVLATLTGTCLAGASSVLLNGSPVASFMPDSDAQVRAVLPVGAAGTIQVTTAQGTSEPANLP